MGVSTYGVNREIFGNNLIMTLEGRETLEYSLATPSAASFVAIAEPNHLVPSWRFAAKRSKVSKNLFVVASNSFVASSQLASILSSCNRGHDLCLPFATRCQESEKGLV